MVISWKCLLAAVCCAAQVDRGSTHSGSIALDGEHAATHTSAVSRSIASFLFLPRSFDATTALGRRALEDGNRPPHVYWALPSAAGVRTCFNGSFATCLWKTARRPHQGGNQRHSTTPGVQNPREI